jgi:hypothetical protein
MIQYTPMEELDRQIAMMPPDPDDERYRRSNPRQRIKVILPKEQICGMRRAGHRPVDIARELGLLPVSVRRVLSSHGLTRMGKRQAQ